MTQYYIGVKQVMARPEQKDGQDGYAVRYPDGYQPWSPKATFEATYLPVGDGIHVTPSKTAGTTGNRLIVEWVPELRKLVDRIKAVPPRRIGNAPLFPTREGRSFLDENDKCNGFDSIWQRFMNKVLQRTKVSERFQQSDLRSKVADDSDTLEEAAARLAHASTDTTQRVYRRKPVRVLPLVRK